MIYKLLLAYITSISILCTGCVNVPEHINQTSTNTANAFDYNTIPEYNNTPYIEINNNKPYFNNTDMTTVFYEHYSELDNLGRTGVAMACLGPETLPTEKRGPIGMIKPAGWHTVKYPDVIKDLYLYNRCHLIAFELSGENANEKNLTTGTRYLNISGMLPFENKTRNYIEDTHNHVIYRVTPVFINNELVCRGILIEAKSVEDNNLEFCVYCYNVQPGIIIDYTTGDSHVK
jgi:hypothetical protein